mmetsp:Transcript_776/g.1654  ORF Transcript_776/g.1654 Transcript_776/m.1654 type:complete len:269 (-) Transcript_776:788-1594(-)
MQSQQRPQQCLHVVSLAQWLLPVYRRRHVRQSSFRRLRLQPSLPREVHERLGRPEVDEVKLILQPLPAEHQVLRLDVSVHVHGRVQLLQQSQPLVGQEQHLPRGHPLGGGEQRQHVGAQHAGDEDVAPVLVTAVRQRLLDVEGGDSLLLEFGQHVVLGGDLKDRLALPRLHLDRNCPPLVLSSHTCALVDDRVSASRQLLVDAELALIDLDLLSHSQGRCGLSKLSFLLPRSFRSHAGRRHRDSSPLPCAAGRVVDLLLLLLDDLSSS